METKIIEYGGLIVKEATKTGYAVAESGDSINLAFPNSETRRGRVGKGCAHTLQTGDPEQVVVEPAICAMRGRNPDNPSGMTKGCPTEQRLEIGGNVSNTLTSVQKDNLVAEPMVGTIWGSKQEHCSVRNDGICPTLTEAMGMGGGQIPMHNYDFRIRKLTPRECFRLMDFDDEDFDKAKAAGVSDSQLYKQAGNSIVVAVLEAIFKQML